MTDEDAFGMWLAGFIDGEGNFDIHRQRRKSGDYYYCRFELALRADDGSVLEMIRARLGGKVYRSDRPGFNGRARWELVARAEVIRLVQLLDRCPLQSKKARDFAIWRAAVRESARTPGRNRPEAMLPFWKQLRSIRTFIGHQTAVGRFEGIR